MFETAEKVPEMVNVVSTKLTRFKSRLRAIHFQCRVMKDDPRSIYNAISGRSQPLAQLVADCSIDIAVLVGDFESIVNKIIGLVELFNHDRRLVSLGRNASITFDEFNGWWVSINDCLDRFSDSLGVFTSVEEILSYEIFDQAYNILDQVDELKKKLLTSCLVIETQPKPVVRVDKVYQDAFSVEFCILKAFKEIRIQSWDLELVSHPDGETHETQEADNVPSVKLRLTCQPEVGLTKIKYEELKLEKAYLYKYGIFPVETADVMVTDKFYLQFRIKVMIDGEVIDLSTVTQRISVVSHPNRLGNAWGIVLWDMALDTMKHQGQGFPTSGSSVSSSNKEYDDVSWDALIESINARFLSYGRGLTDKNKNHLMKKLFRGNNPVGNLVTWNLFAKDVLVEVEISTLLGLEEDDQRGNAPAKKFTYWEWLWGCMALLEWEPSASHCQSLREIWKQGKIEGFIGEEDLNNTLRLPSNKPGSFIIRFPERRPESIGIYLPSPNGLLWRITNREEDLEYKSLQKRILENYTLLYLYPNIPKRDAFREAKTSHLTSILRFHQTGTDRWVCRVM